MSKNVAIKKVVRNFREKSKSLLESMTGDEEIDFELEGEIYVRAIFSVSLIYRYQGIPITDEQSEQILRKANALNDPTVCSRSSIWLQLAKSNREDLVSLYNYSAGGARVLD